MQRSDWEALVCALLKPNRPRPNTILVPPANYLVIREAIKQGIRLRRRARMVRKKRRGWA